MAGRACKVFIKLILVLLLLGVTFTTPIYANDAINVTIDGWYVDFGEQSPVVIDGRTLVPIRPVFEAIGFLVSWNPDLRQIVMNNHLHEIIVIEDYTVFLINGIGYPLDVPVQFINGVAMIPIRSILINLDFDVEWNALAQTVVVTSRPIFSDIEAEHNDYILFELLQLEAYEISENSTAQFLFVAILALFGLILAVKIPKQAFVIGERTFERQGTIDSKIAKVSKIAFLASVAWLIWVAFDNYSHTRPVLSQVGWLWLLVVMLMALTQYRLYIGASYADHLAKRICYAVVLSICTLLSARLLIFYYLFATSLWIDFTWVDQDLSQLWVLEFGEIIRTLTSLVNLLGFWMIFYDLFQIPAIILAIYICGGILAGIVGLFAYNARLNKVKGIVAEQEAEEAERQRQAEEAARKQQEERERREAEERQRRLEVEQAEEAFQNRVKAGEPEALFEMAKRHYKNSSLHDASEMLKASAIKGHIEAVAAFIVSEIDSLINESNRLQQEKIDDEETRYYLNQRSNNIPSVNDFLNGSASFRDLDRVGEEQSRLLGEQSDLLRRSENRVKRFKTIGERLEMLNRLIEFFTTASNQMQQSQQDKLVEAKKKISINQFGEIVRG